MEHALCVVHRWWWRRRRRGGEKEGEQQLLSLHGCDGMPLKFYYISWARRRREEEEATVFIRDSARGRRRLASPANEGEADQLTTFL